MSITPSTSNTTPSLASTVLTTPQYNNTHDGFTFDRNEFKKWLYGLYSAYMCLGTPLNLWFLAAIVTATSLRSKLRVQMICAVLVSNIIKGTVMSSLEIVVIYHNFELGERVHCSLETLTTVSSCISGLVENWYILIWLTAYIASLIKTDIWGRLSPIVLKICKIVALIGPAVVCGIAGISVLAYHSHQKFGPHSKGCLRYTMNAYHVFKRLAISVPFFLQLATIPVMLLLFYWLKRRERTTAVPLVEPRMPEVDQPVAYVVTCTICTLTTFPLVLIDEFDLPFSSFIDEFIYTIVTNCINQFQIVFLPLCLLLLPAIRERIRTWRPWHWHRPAPGVDPVLRYQKDDE